MKKNRTAMKKEKEDRELYKFLEGEIKKVQGALKLLYWGDKGGNEDFLHRIFLTMENLKDCLFDHILDKHSLKEILDTRRPRPEGYPELPSPAK